MERIRAALFSVWDSQIDMQIGRQADGIFGISNQREEKLHRCTFQNIRDGNKLTPYRTEAEIRSSCTTLTRNTTIRL